MKKIEKKCCKTKKDVLQYKTFLLRAQKNIKKIKKVLDKQKKESIINTRDCHKSSKQKSTKKILKKVKKVLDKTKYQ